MEAPKLEFSKERVGRTTRQKVDNTLTEELFFGVCAPIGSLKKEVIVAISDVVSEKYGYDVEVIKLSKFIEQYKTEEFKLLDSKTEAYSKLTYKINQGDEIRKKFNNNSVLVELAIQDIHSSRISDNKAVQAGEAKVNDTTTYKSRRKCYIFDSIKNKEELLLLRKVYTKNFFQFSVFSPMKERQENLHNKDLSKTETANLVSIDDFENNDFGQNVRNTFTDGDFFLRISKTNLDELPGKVERFFHLIFESDIITPTVNEKAMYAAKSAAGNSACLSRQVGASIVDSKGDAISIGWNDVPKFGGNLYREGEINDDRCKLKGYCSNDNQKDILVQSIIDSIKEDDKVKSILENKEGGFDLKIIENLKKNLRVSKVKDLIEFSRSVHAEMHAIISGSQLSGDRMINGKLFCTTYPCHNCARHIIVAGIKEVYYIEPYIKSLCLTLHSDAMTEDEDDESKVRILIFDGVAPRNYLTFFTNFVERKNKKGKIVKVDLKTAKPKISKSLQALPTLEQQAIHSLKECGVIE